MRVLVTGAEGQLGSSLIKYLHSKRVECLGTGKKDIDFRNQSVIYSFIDNYKPSVIVHCGGYTNVEQAETEIEKCLEINVKGTEAFAKAASNVNAKILYVSTDYVFSGEKNGLYEVFDEKNPLNVYGNSKALGEEAILKHSDKFYILRTSWMFGNGRNFVDTIVKLSKVNNKVRVVQDQVGSPTYANDLVVLIAQMIETNEFGIYHATNEGFCSWADLAEAIIRMMEKDTLVERVKTEELDYKAMRPKNSKLSKKSLDDKGFARLPSWQNALERYLKQKGDNANGYSTI